MIKLTIEKAKSLVLDFENSTDSTAQMFASRAILINAQHLLESRTYEDELTEADHIVLKWAKSRLLAIMAGDCACVVFGQDKSVGRPSNNVRDNEIYMRIALFKGQISEKAKIEAVAKELKEEKVHFLSESAVRTIYYRQKKHREEFDKDEVLNDFGHALNEYEKQQTPQESQEKKISKALEAISDLLQSDKTSERRKGIRWYAKEQLDFSRRFWKSKWALLIIQKISGRGGESLIMDYGLEVLERLAAGEPPNDALGYTDTRARADHLRDSAISEDWDESKSTPSDH